jgi:hypothetical protein
MVIAGIDPDPSNADAIKTWARAYWEALRSHTMGGGYVNFMMEEGDDRIKATYGENFEICYRTRWRPRPYRQGAEALRLSKRWGHAIHGGYAGHGRVGKIMVNINQTVP